MKLSDIRFKLLGKPPEKDAVESTPQAAVNQLQTGETGRLPDLPMAKRSLLSLRTLISCGLAVILLLTPLVLKDVPESYIIITRITASLGVGFDLLWRTIGTLRAKNFSYDGLPILLAVVLAFLNNMSLEGTIAITVFAFANLLRDYAYHKTSEAMLAPVSLPELSTKLALGDSFILEAGQSAPADCVVIRGSIKADVSMLSCGELKRTVHRGDTLPAGCRILSGTAIAEATDTPAKSAAAKFAQLLKTGFTELTRTERLINRIAGISCLAFLGVAALTLFIAPLLTDLAFPESTRRVITIVAISSPCGALTALPLVYLASLIRQHNFGAVFFSAKALDDAAYTKAIVFDKAGTISSPSFKLAEIDSVKLDTETLLRVAAHAVSSSRSPMALAILEAFGEQTNRALVSEFSEQAGWGVSVKVKGIAIHIGTVGFMTRSGIAIPMEKSADCTLYMTVAGELAGRFALKNPLDAEMPRALESLAQSGFDRVVMLSGDGRERDRHLAHEAGIIEYYSECSEADRVKHIQSLRSRIETGGTVTYVCADDGSAIAAHKADLAIVAGCTNPDALNGAAGALLLGAAAKLLPEAMSGAKRARLYAAIFALTALLLKLLITVLALAGLSPLWFGITLDSITTLALIVGSIFVSRVKSE